MVYIPDGTFVRDKLTLVSIFKSKWAGTKEYLSTAGYMQPLHFKAHMSAKDMVEHVETIFKSSRPLPRLWSWAFLQPASQNLNPAAVYSPWDTSLDNLHARCLNTQFICIIPETWETQHHSGFRRAVAQAISRDPVSWEPLPKTPVGPPLTQAKKGKRRAVRETSSELDREEQRYRDAEALEIAMADPTCPGCGRSYPTDRLEWHVTSCAKAIALNQVESSESEPEGVVDLDGVQRENTLDADPGNRDVIAIDDYKNLGKITEDFQAVSDVGGTPEPQGPSISSQYSS